MTKDEAVEMVAKDILNLPTLEDRGRDALDFHELSVHQIKRALEEAYDAGVRESIIKDSERKSNG